MLAPAPAPRHPSRVAGRVGAAAIEAHALISRANCRGYFGDAEGAIADGLNARAIGLELGAPEIVIRAYYTLGFLYAIHAKRFEDSAAVNLEGYSYAERHGLVRTAAASGIDLLAGAAFDFYALGRCAYRTRPPSRSRRRVATLGPMKWRFSEQEPIGRLH